MIDLIKRNWEWFARGAFQCAVDYGRGAVTMYEEDALSGKFECGFRIEEDDLSPNSEVAQQVREYNPQNEVIVLVRRASGDEYCLRIRTPRQGTK